MSHYEPPRPGPEPAEGDLLGPGMLHELRQPLMAASAAAVLLERTLGAPLARQADWRMLRNQLARISEILNGYEELLRSDTAAPSAFEVEPVVARAIDLLAHRVGPLAPRFTFENGGGHHAGFGEPGALVHAATNLLSNALDAVESVAGPGRITVRVLESRAGGVEVRVSDEGTGIPAELRGRIFEPRFTTKPPGKGTGLGLHIARRLIGRFGGSVYLVDERDPDRLPWAVTEFCIEMPAPPPGAEVRP